MAKKNVRSEFILNEERINFTRDEEEGALFGPQGKDSPIGRTLISFEREYTKNERFAHGLFIQLLDLIEEFTKETDENFYYNNMDIVRLFKEIVKQYNNWSSAMRINTLLAKETLQEIQNIVETYYVSQEELNDARDEMSATFEEYMKGRIPAEVVRTAAGSLIIRFSEEQIKNLNLRKGDRVFVSKFKGIS